MRPRSIDIATDSAGGKFGSVRTGVVSSGIPSLSRQVLGPIVAGIIVCAWLSSGEPVRDPTPMRLARGEPGAMTLGFAFSPDGKAIATTDHVGRVAIWDIQDAWAIDRVLDYDGNARSVAFSPDGRSLAVGGAGAEIRVFDFPSGQTRLTLPAPAGTTRALAFSPDGKVLASTSSRNGHISMYDLDTGRLRTTLRGDLPALSIAFSPDGRSLAAGASEEKNVTLWDLETGRRRVLLRDVTGTITSVAFSPDGRLLADVCWWDRAAAPLGREVGPAASSDRGACRWHDLGVFLTGWWHTGHIRQ